MLYFLGLLYIFELILLCFWLLEPRPPTSWKSSDNSGKIKTRQQKYHRSASVGSNVVERSKKHWTGRPIGKEVFPKRPFNEKVRVIPSMKNPPLAEEYQTANGVPFPTKTGRH